MTTPSKKEGERRGDDWRLSPGYVLEVLEGVTPGHFCNSQFASFQVLLGAFLFNEKPSPLTDRPLFDPRGSFEWGAVPLEKVIRDRAAMDRIALYPFISRNSITILEPFDCVGFVGNRGVRASKNVAYALQLISNCDSVLYPLWESGVRSGNSPDAICLEQLLPVISASRAVVVEGGYGSAFEEESWENNVSLPDMLALMKNMVLNRMQMRAPSIFICLGHQLACEAITALVKQVVDETMELCQQHAASGKPLPSWLKRYRDICASIEEVGAGIKVRSPGMTVQIDGWRHPQFTVTRNDAAEVGRKRLHPFIPCLNKDFALPDKLYKAHHLTGQQFSQHIINTVTRVYGVPLATIFFHNDRVNFEAVLFANWALRKLHTALLVHRTEVVKSSLSWTLNLPSGIEVCASTVFEDGGDSLQAPRVHTCVAATAIFYQDLESGSTKYSYTLQFHPELCEGTKIVGDRGEDGELYAPSFAELKKSDGIQLLCRMLHVGAQSM